MLLHLRPNIPTHSSGNALSPIRSNGDVFAGAATYLDSTSDHRTLAGDIPRPIASVSAVIIVARWLLISPKMKRWLSLYRPLPILIVTSLLVAQLISTIEARILISYTVAICAISVLHPSASPSQKIRSLHHTAKFHAPEHACSATW